MLRGFLSPPKSRNLTMLPNEEFALACRAYYEEQGLIVDATNGQFAHCPLPKGMGETGYYLLWEHHQLQGLLQSRDVGRKCFWGGDAKKWLTSCNYWPDNFFELWDIYDDFIRDTHQLQTPEARSKNAEAIRARDFFPTVHLHTPEVRAKIVETRRERDNYPKQIFLTAEQKAQAVKTRRENGNYPKNPEWLNTPEAREKQAETLRQLYQTERGIALKVAHSRKMSKPVEITLENGRVDVYPSAKFAAAALGIHPSSLCNYLKGKQKPTLPISVRYV